jgi:8-oxo-dGTP diphosphatase
MVPRPTPRLDLGVEPPIRSATMAPMEAIPDDPGRRGAVGICLRDGRMLVIRRSQDVVAPRVYCFPGGGIEADESEQEALIREFREEIGVTVRPLRRLWQCVTAWKVELAWWLCELEPDAKPVPNPAEVASIHWVTPRQMLRFPDLLESNREFLQRVQRGQIELSG